MKLYDKNWKRALIVAVFLSATISVPALADTISYYLDLNNAGLPAANYLQVTISDGSSGGYIDFQVDVLRNAFPSPGTNFGMQSFLFNFDSTFNIGAGNIVNINPSTWDINVDRNAGGGFGKFDFQLTGNGSSRTESLTFSIANIVGDMPSSYAVGNPDGNPGAIEFFSAHVGDFSGFPDDAVESAKFAGSTLVPIPTSLVLLGSGLAGLVGLVRRRRS